MLPLALSIWGVDARKWPVMTRVSSDESVLHMVVELSWSSVRCDLYFVETFPWTLPFYLSSVEHPSEYWRVSFHPWPCARGFASDVMLSGQLVRPCHALFLSCAVQPC
eukprot:443139-Pelagomonas_calceolata.AAC.5